MTVYFALPEISQANYVEQTDNVEKLQSLITDARNYTKDLSETVDTYRFLCTNSFCADISLLQSLCDGGVKRARKLLYLETYLGNMEIILACLQQKIKIYEDAI